MKKKTTSIVIMFLLIGISIIKAQNSGNSVTDAILSAYSARMFTDQPVRDSDLELILNCGIKAPSARNSQAWKFNVIKDASLVSDIMRNMTQGNVIIIISGLDQDQQGINVAFDCALAVENMYIAAQGLGLGAHIYTSPVNTINTKMRESLGIPDGYRAIAVLRIGNVDKSVDALSSASTRKPFEEVVIYK